MLRVSPRKVVLTLAVLFVLAQVIRPARTNPPVDASRTIQTHTQMTPEVNAILNRSCRDCHSNETVWPWYSNVAPVSWLLVSHVNEGRHHLSLSEWGSNTQSAADKKLREMCDQVRKGEMPMSSYVLGHRDAALSDADKDALCAWTTRERAALVQ